MDKKECYHNYPYEDENPKFFSMIAPTDFGEIASYKCKHCNRIYSFDFDSVEGVKFEEEYEKIKIIHEQEKKQEHKDVQS